MAFNGTAVGTIAYGTGQTGFGQCLSLVGTGYVTLASVTAGTTGTGQTVEGWFKTSATSNSTIQGIVSGNGWYVAMQANKLVFAWNAITQTYTTPTTYNNGVWHHFAMVWDTSGNLLCFVDGALMNTATAGASRIAINTIGSYNQASANEYNGLIDDIVWTKAPKYSANFTVPATPAVDSAPNQIAIWHLEGVLTDTNVVYTAPVAGVLSRTARGFTTQTIVTTAASSGSGTGYTYQFQRSTDGTTYSNIGSAATFLAYADSGLTANTKYYYRVLVTDSAAATAFSSVINVTTKDYAGRYILFVGDSITFGYQLSSGQAPPDYVSRFLKTYNIGTSGSLRNIEYANTGIVGSTTAQWVSGQTNMTNALTAGATIGATVAHIMLGTNDANTTNNVTQASYLSNLTNIVTTLQSNGYTTIIISYPPYPNDSAHTGQQALLVSYQSAIDSLVNGSTVFSGDKLAYSIFQANAAAYTSAGAGSFFQADGLHPNEVGAQQIALLWEFAIGNLAGIMPTAGNRSLAV